MYDTKIIASLGCSQFIDNADTLFFKQSKKAVSNLKKELKSQATPPIISMCSNPTCQNELTHEMLYCSKCGTKREENEQSCPNCNHKISSDVVFCNQCGSKTK